MLIYVNITDRQTDRQTYRQTHQKYSSEPHKNKNKIKTVLFGQNKSENDYGYKLRTD